MLLGLRCVYGKNKTTKTINVIPAHSPITVVEMSRVWQPFTALTNTLLHSTPGAHITNKSFKMQIIQQGYFSMASEQPRFNQKSCSESLLHTIP